MLRNNIIRTGAMVVVAVAATMVIGYKNVGAVSDPATQSSSSSTQTSVQSQANTNTNAVPAVNSTPVTNAQPTSDVPLEIIPVCSDSPSMVSRWTVTNKNATPVQLSWNNVENNRSGNFTAAPGTTSLLTYYNAKDPNNRTEFRYSGNVSSTNAQVAACTPITPVPPVSCVDGTDAQKFTVTIERDAASNLALATIVTKDGGLLCDDASLYFSSYTMPDNYDGKDFVGNASAYPQQIFDSAHVVIKKGTNGAAIFIIALPEPCKNTQVDLYFGPEIEVVGANGHGTQNIKSDLYFSEGACEPGNGGQTPDQPTTPTQPPVTTVPGQGGAGHTTTEIVKQPVAAEQAELPAELPVTGGVSNLGFIIALLAALATYGAVYFATPKRARL